MSVILSQLLKKSFEIISDVENKGVSRDDLEDILNILKDQKRKPKVSFDSTVSPQEREALLGRGNKSHEHSIASLRSWKDPFEDVVKKKESQPVSDFPKFNKNKQVINKGPRQMKKSHEKFDTRETDYGEQQRQLQKARNAKMVGAMIFLGVVSIFIAMIALRVSS